MLIRSRAAFVVAVVAVLVVPASAGAATKTVDVGTPVSLEKTLQKQAVDVNAYFPASTRIHVGDSVSFVPVGFHDVYLPKKGGKANSLLATQGPISGVNDAAGAPFWFNGKDNVGFNPALVKSLLGKKVTYTGAKAIESGLPLANRPKPMVVKFTKAGTYSYFCSVHPGMKGKVTVVGSSKSVPSAKADKATIKKQVAAVTSSAKGLATTKAPANTVIVGPVSKTGAELFGFAPAQLTVPVGTTVNFTMPTASTDEHTVSFGPGDPESDPKSYLGALAATFGGAPTFAPAGIYPSEPTGTTAGYTPTLHGNGFWNSGVMYGASRGYSYPSSGKLTFTQAGTYNFYCLIHPFMKGTVKVQ